MTGKKLNLKEVLNTAQEIRVTYMKTLAGELKNSVHKLIKRFFLIKKM